MSANVRFWRLDVDVEFEYNISKHDIAKLRNMVAGFAVNEELNMFNANELVIDGESIWVDEWNSEEVQWYLDHECNGCSVDVAHMAIAC